MRVLSLLLLAVQWRSFAAFSSGHFPSTRSLQQVAKSRSALDSTTAESSEIQTTKEAVGKLKKVLEREYVSFFNPMKREFYAEDVTFDDPMTSLTGVDAYQNNVDMLSSRTLLGSLLFRDASIALHSVTGGEVSPTDGSIANIVTRWTLRFCFKVLPWAPTARFSGISLYEVSKGGSEGVVVTKQTDYWDSINLKEGGEYGKVGKGVAISDFLNQLQSDNGNAAAAGPEVPYQLLRRGDGYEIRRYPSYTVATIPYDRRDEGYDVLATITKGINPLAPAVMQVPNDNSQKTMSWPLVFAAPGEDAPSPIDPKILEKIKEPLWSDCKVETIPSRVVAVGSFSDASVAPIVRKADKALREVCSRDGIAIPESTATSVKFAQYDAIFSLGKRRGEVWIELEDGGHPW